MYEIWYDYVNRKQGEKSNCYIDTDSFIVFIKPEDVGTRFATSNCQLEKQRKEQNGYWLKKERIRWKNNDLVRKIKNKIL